MENNKNEMHIFGHGKQDERNILLVNKHFEESLQYANQKKSRHWPQNRTQVSPDVEYQRRNDALSGANETRQIVQERVIPKDYGKDFSNANPINLKNMSTSSKFPPEVMQNYIHYSANKSKYGINSMTSNVYSDKESSLKHHMKSDRMYTNPTVSKQLISNQHLSSFLPDSVQDKRHGTAVASYNLPSNTHASEYRRHDQSISLAQSYSKRSPFSQPVKTYLPSHFKQTNHSSANQNDQHSTSNIPQLGVKMSSSSPQMYGQPKLFLENEEVSNSKLISISNRPLDTPPPPAHSNSKSSSSHSQILSQFEPVNFSSPATYSKNLSPSLPHTYSKYGNNISYVEKVASYHSEHVPLNLGKRDSTSMSDLGAVKSNSDAIECKKLKLDEDSRSINYSPDKSLDSDKIRTVSPHSPGYVHKLKKTWLQRHACGDSEEILSSSDFNDTDEEAKIPSLSSHKQFLSDVKSVEAHHKSVEHIDSSSIGLDENSGSSSSFKSGVFSDDTNKRKANESTTGNKENLTSDTEAKDVKSSLTEKSQLKDLSPSTLSAESEASNPLPPKPSIFQLKKTGQSFLQDRSCFEVAPKLAKCRECRWTTLQRSKKLSNIFCRFYAFRRLKYAKNGQLTAAGFSDPVKDARGDDLQLWMPDASTPAVDLNVEKSKFLLTHVGDQFCDLVQQEKEAQTLHLGYGNVAWKRVVQGVREMCDVCETTLFNIHWACDKCGFVVCIDCYKDRKEGGSQKAWTTGDSDVKERDKFSWLLCNSKVPHEQDRLMLTQIITGDALNQLALMIHQIRRKWNVPTYCGCSESKNSGEGKSDSDVNLDSHKDMKDSSCDDTVSKSPVESFSKTSLCTKNEEHTSNSPLDFFAKVALSSKGKRGGETSNSDSESDDKEDHPSSLRELLSVRSVKSEAVKEDSVAISSDRTNRDSFKKKAKLEKLDDVISCVIDKNSHTRNSKDVNVELKHFVRKYNYGHKGREPLPIRIMTKTESRLLYPDVPHSWLCDGKLLRLLDSLHDKNIIAFQDQWERGQPVIISGTGKYLNQDLWKPEAFCRDFGEVKNNLINCLTDNLVPNQPMKKFWDGFENYSKRLRDDKGQPMILKLKDWPPSDDFAEMLPCRFNDLMKVLPMADYTRRNGCYNLAGRLPESFVRPDLGPKMYIAYGSASHPGRASTNLHLDISDAVNVMCYVGIPKDLEYDDSIKDVLKAVDEAGCDILTRQRVRDKTELPGALWHIYHAKDSDKIRDLLNKIAIERGKKLEPHHDPIHDQSWYLDGPLRDRLYKEYGVEGYAIVQCMGDALFIPAGAPHQVRNLHNCIKVAEDFVSPENISHCFHLTQEFRHLSDTHTNHEDKLQIKNIIYHAMKDAAGCLLAASS